MSGLAFLVVGLLVPTLAAAVATLAAGEDFHDREGLDNWDNGLARVDSYQPTTERTP